MPLTALPTRAASISFRVDNLSGSLDGESLLGSFQFDDSGLTGTGAEFRPVSNLAFNFLGTNFTEADAAFTSEVVFSDSQLLGLSYAVGDPNSDNIAFSFVPGFSSIDEALFSYDTTLDGSGFGDVRYVRVPESSTVLGSVTMLGAILLLQRRRRKHRAFAKAESQT